MIHAAPEALLVRLAQRPDFSAIERMPRGPERKEAAWDALVTTARTSQAPLLELTRQLQAAGQIASVEAMTSPNMLIVTPARGATQAVADAMRGAAGVAAVYSNQHGGKLTGDTQFSEQPPIAVPIGLDELGERTTYTSAPQERPYGIDLIGAPDGWARGADGHGLVYGSIDTGVDVSHEAIAARYRGRHADGTLNHDYNWFDASGASTPRDENGHGTHTIGTVVGAGIGVAPQATFISARGLGGDGFDGILRSLQWMQAPTRVNGTNADPTKAPDVVGMSWFAGPATGDIFEQSIQNLRAAGIEPVKSAGNRGPDDGTITSPGQHPELITTAAVDAAGSVARFSSRGPAPYPVGDTTAKPDFAAPGVDVVSSMPNGRYAKMSGTSMAQPHMSGAVLAILSRYPQLTHQQLVAVLTTSAVDQGPIGVDAAYGAGIINIPGALSAAELLTRVDQSAPR